jgi:hypothetical protein
MTGTEMIAHLRMSVLNDKEVPYLWLDEELLRYLNNAERQACQRTFRDLPATEFTASESPEIEEQYHYGLMDWAAHLAYLKHDKSEVGTYDPNLAAVYERKFTMQFGALPTAYSDFTRKTVTNRQRMTPIAFGS